MKIAIIGSGPAGMSSANLLISNNVDVTVFDELEEFGGMLAYGLPEYRIPLSQIRENINKAKDKGIKFVYKKIVNVLELLKENGGDFDKVILAIGAGPGLKLNLPGEDLEGIVDSLEFLKKDKVNQEKMFSAGKTVGVIGGGNSAIDAAMIAHKQGAKVTVLYRRTEKEMPAFGNELEQAKEAGIKFNFLNGPIEYKKSESGKIIVKLAIMNLGEEDKSGRARPIDSGERIEEEFDSILLAVGQRNNLDFLEKEGIKCEWGKVIVNETSQTSVPNIYAAGDLVTGAKNIASATITGSKAARHCLIDN